MSSTNASVLDQSTILSFGKFYTNSEILCEGNTLVYSYLNPSFNSLPNGKILDQMKLETFADDNFNLVLTVQFFLDRVENIVRKGENAGDQYFLLFPECFSLKTSCSGSLKVGIVW